MYNIKTECIFPSWALGSIRKQAEQAMESNLVSSISPWLLVQFLLPGCCLEFLPWLPSEMNYNIKAEINPFFLQADFGQWFPPLPATAIEGQTRTCTKHVSQTTPYNRKHRRICTELFLQTKYYLIPKLNKDNNKKIQSP